MQPELLIVAAICAVLGFVIAALLGWVFSRALLVLLWIGLGGTAVIYAGMSFLPGTDGLTASSYQILAGMMVLPAFLTSLLGGWLGLRQKGRNAS